MRFDPEEESLMPAMLTEPFGVRLKPRIAAQVRILAESAEMRPATWIRQQVEELVQKEAARVLGASEPEHAE